MVLNQILSAYIKLQDIHSTAGYGFSQQTL